jgi:hypothetical protein
MSTPRKRSTDLAVGGDGKLDLSEVLAMIKAGQKLHLVETDEDNEQMAIEILERTFAAQTADELFSEVGTTKVEDFLNRPFQLRDVKFRNSDYDEGLGIYAIMSGVTEHGEVVTIAAGSSNVVVKCIKALDVNALPRWVKLVDDKTKGGFTVYNLVGVNVPVRSASVAQAEGF